MNSSNERLAGIQFKFNDFWFHLIALKSEITTDSFGLQSSPDEEPEIECETGPEEEDQ